MQLINPLTGTCITSQAMKVKNKTSTKTSIFFTFEVLKTVLNRKFLKFEKSGKKKEIKLTEKTRRKWEIGRIIRYLLTYLQNVNRERCFKVFIFYLGIFQCFRLSYWITWALSLSLVQRVHEYISNFNSSIGMYG